MKINIFDSVKRVHFIGIGGIGVSGLAMMFLKYGKKISGSDNTETSLTRKLRKKGIKIFIGQKEKNVTSNIELIVYSQAILPDNPEYRKALLSGIPVLSYPETVGMLMEKKKGIAVAGTHGKTTTSALIVSLLRKGGVSPSFVIGGEIIGTGNSGVGNGEYLVVEACEYKKSFLNYRPEIAVITSMEEDHLDYYKNFEEIKRAFREFCRHVKKNGFLIYRDEDRDIEKVVKGISALKTISFGLKKGLWQARNIVCKSGFTLFDCYVKEKFLERIKLGINGTHNVLNSLAALAVGSEIGIPWKELKNGVESFKGVHRRCEMKGIINGIKVIDDYAHHPTEIKNILRCMRDLYPKNRLIVVFQPHQYSRTRFLLKDFASSFSLADKVVVPDIYFVRDSMAEKKLVNAEILVDKIRKNGKESLYLPTFNEIVIYLTEIVRAGDVILTMGAGPVNKVGEELIDKLKNKNFRPKRFGGSASGGKN